MFNQTTVSDALNNPGLTLDEEVDIVNSRELHDLSP
jgi:hypothetical protein